MTPKWVSVAVDPEGSIVGVDNHGRMLRALFGGWETLPEPPPPPEPSTDWKALVEGAVRNARPDPYEVRSRWSCVAQVFRFRVGADDARAKALCREFGLNPDEVLETDAGGALVSGTSPEDE